MSSNQNPVVAVDHVQKSFGEVKVLRDISLAVNPGEVVAIIGPSGGGKSTLLRCMTLLERVDAGDLTYGDLTCAKDGTYGDKALLAQARQRFGLVFQNYNLFPHFSVLRNVMDAPICVQRWRSRRGPCWPRWALRATRTRCPASSLAASSSVRALPVRLP